MTDGEERHRERRDRQTETKTQGEERQIDRDKDIDRGETGRQTEIGTQRGKWEKRKTERRRQ